MLTTAYTISQQETDQVERLHERKLSLRNLMARLESQDGCPEYLARISVESVREAFAHNMTELNSWWVDTLLKYDLVRQPGHVYTVDFSARQILLNAANRENS